MKKTSALKLTSIALGMLLSAGVMATNPGNPAPDPGPNPGPGTSFPPVSNFANSGSFSVTNSNVNSNCTVYRPRTLGENNRRHPIILWGNGTGGSPSTYSGLLEHWASHGFVVAAARTSNAGSGDEMISCLNYLVTENGRSSGTFAGKLNVNRVATAGHSQGGGGSIMAAQDNRVTVSAPFQPYTIGLGHRSSSQSNQNGPMFLMTGGSDSIASPRTNAQPVFNRANVPVFWGELRGAGHFVPTGNAGGFRGPSTAWMRFHLMDDLNAESTFYGRNCTLCGDRNWTVQRKGIN